MKPQVIGISGSPIKNSNTDRVVQAVLKNTGLEIEFIKLSKRKVQPCIACLGCAKDNVCKVKDDFQEIAEKVKYGFGWKFLFNWKTKSLPAVHCLKIGHCQSQKCFLTKILSNCKLV